MVLPEYIRTDGHGYRWVSAEAVQARINAGHRLTVNEIYQAIHKRPHVRHMLHRLKGIVPCAETLSHFGKEYKTFIPVSDEDMEEAGKCYGNSHSLGLAMAQSRQEKVYTEGLFIDAHAPYLHAWVVKHGIGIDVTYQAQGWETYFGVQFSLGFLEDVRMVLGSYYPLFNNWEKTAPYVLNYLRSELAA